MAVPGQHRPPLQLLNYFRRQPLLAQTAVRPDTFDLCGVAILRFISAGGDNFALTLKDDKQPLRQMCIRDRVQAISPIDIALWDMKAKRAGLPLAKLLGSHRDSVQCYNTSGGFLHTPLDQVLKNVAISRENGIGGIKLKVGQPDTAEDIRRLTAVREVLGDDFPLMVDANQQWDRETAIRMGRKMEPFNLIWIEEPLDAYDVEGHAQLAAALDTPIATGEMLTSFREHEQLILGNASDFVHPDAPRVGGISPFLKIMDLAAKHGRKLAPHFAMEVHLHLAAAYPLEPWLEHFEWLNPLFNEQLELRDGRMWVSERHGLGFTLSEQARRWTQQSCEFGTRP